MMSVDQKRPEKRTYSHKYDKNGGETAHEQLAPGACYIFSALSYSACKPAAPPKIKGSVHLLAVPLGHVHVPL
jgi:hypothetical protein